MHQTTPISYRHSTDKSAATLIDIDMLSQSFDDELIRENYLQLQMIGIVSASKPHRGDCQIAQADGLERPWVEAFERKLSAR